MQYKIPVQIENEDPILLGLSLRQLTVIMIFGGIAYGVFQGLQPSFGNEIALIPTIIITTIGIVIAIFKYSEMTFIPFVLAFIRYKVNLNTRQWLKGTDSFSVLDIGYVVDERGKSENKVDFQDKLNKMKEIEDKLEKI